MPSFERMSNRYNELHLVLCVMKFKEKNISTENNSYFFKRLFFGLFFSDFQHLVFPILFWFFFPNINLPHFFILSKAKYSTGVKCG